jgi:eukaryotic-like serine/threonine-protein kinase
VTPTQRRKRITDVFEVAVQLRPEEWQGFVEHECHGDDVLLKEVRSLLSAYQRHLETSSNLCEDARDDELQPIPKRIGKYEIARLIGSGGFGRVYCALDPTFGRVVAIKVLNAPDDPNIVRRFKVEARTVANLHHRNIVTVHDFGEQDGLPFLVMEYLNGATIQDLIRENSLTLLDKLEIMAEVAEGLHYAHEKGVTHRDVKPANIIRLTDHSVKIMDFGIARLAQNTGSGTLTRTGFVIGSLMYMAPEQFTGTSDAVSDVFGYGVTFYELLTGHNPFATSDPAVVIYRITNTDVAPLRSVQPECPAALERIVQGCLARSRAVRYASLADVAVDTRAILLDMRREVAGRLYSDASQLLVNGELDAAKSAVRKALEADPEHSGARGLREEIEKELRLRDTAGRAASLMDKVEEGLRARHWADAAEALSAVRQLGVSSPHLQARVDQAEAHLERARQCERLLATAREDLRKENLSDAFQAVSQVLSSDPANDSGQYLLQEIRNQMASREARRRLEEELARAEGLLLIGETDQASALLDEIERSHPHAPEAAALRARAQAQKAREVRARRLEEGNAEVKSFLRGEQFEPAIQRIDQLLSEFGDNAGLQSLRRHATERLAARQRLERIAAVKSGAAAMIAHGDFLNAIRALEAGVAQFAEDSELTELLQAAVAGKAASEAPPPVVQTPPAAPVAAAAAPALDTPPAPESPAPPITLDAAYQEPEPVAAGSALAVMWARYKMYGIAALLLIAVIVTVVLVTTGSPEPARGLRQAAPESTQPPVRSTPAPQPPAGKVAATPPKAEPEPPRKPKSAPKPDSVLLEEELRKIDESMGVKRK